MVITITNDLNCPILHLFLPFALRVTNFDDIIKICSISNACIALHSANNRTLQTHQLICAYSFTTKETSHSSLKSQVLKREREVILFRSHSTTYWYVWPTSKILAKWHLKQNQNGSRVLFCYKKFLKTSFDPSLVRLLVINN